MTRHPIAAAALALAAVATFAQVSPEPPQEVTLVETQLRINATLLEIRDLIARQLEGESLRLLLDRSRLASDRAERLETRLRTVSGERRDLEAERTRIEVRRETIRESAEASGNEPEIARAELIERQLEVELARIRDRTKALDSEIAELEGRVLEEREAAEGWQDLADRRLGGL